MKLSFLLYSHNFSLALLYLLKSIKRSRGQWVNILLRYRTKMFFYINLYQEPMKKNLNT